MKVLVLGSGGREHALAWKIGQSPSCETVFLHPGNAGTEQAGFPSLGAPTLSLNEITASAKENQISLIIIGPENLLIQGYADHFRNEGFMVVGPNQDSARLETSKIFAKEFMMSAEIPTSDYAVASDAQSLTRLCEKYPCVLKLDGLAAGKGVVIAQNDNEVNEFADRVWKEKEFGEGSHRILIEDFIVGKEISYIGMCDGSTFIPLDSATDYKKLQTGDRGPNTGGMGAISPSPYLTQEIEEKIQSRIVCPLLKRMKEIHFDYKGALYIGLMVTPNGDPYVLEFNTRFGDPETQAILLRLKSDFVPLLEATARGELRSATLPVWGSDVSIYVVVVAAGYPEKPEQGDTIKISDCNATLFFSSVAKKENDLVTAGGRVLGLGILAPDFEMARIKIYRELCQVFWRARYFRTDIGLFE